MVHLRRNSACQRVTVMKCDPARLEGAMGLQKDYKGSMSLITVLRFCTLRGNNRGRRNIEFGQLTGKKWVFGKFRDEFRKLCACHFRLFLAQGRQRQQNFRKRPEIMAVLGGDFELLDPHFLVAVDSSKGKKQLLVYRQASDDVIRRAQGE